MFYRRFRKKKLILRQFQSPGDIVMLTAALRDLHSCYPARFITDVRTSAPALWEHNPFITPLSDDDRDVEIINCEYPLIHRCNQAPYHFIHGFIEFLNDRLDLAIRPQFFKGDIHLSDEERSWISQVHEITGEDRPFWLIVAGGKFDYTIKWWETSRYQEVVDYFQNQILFVQVGEDEHRHPPLDGVIDLRGKTDLRQLVRLVYHSWGVLTPVSLLMHLAAAVETRQGTPRQRPCVVVAGGREPSHWEAYPHHQFIHTLGALPCCAEGGCWKSRVIPLGDGDDKDKPDSLCMDVVCELPRCMDMITSADVIRRIEMYLPNRLCPNAKSTMPADMSVKANLRPDLPLSANFREEELIEENARTVAERFIEKIPPYPGHFRGRGIIICGGGVKYFTPAWVCINILRRLDCRLPVQIWYLGETEMSAQMKSLVKPLDVECIDASAMRKKRPARILNGWELKSYALIHCPFQEIILIDADNMPLRDPEFLFATPEFRRTGAIFWPDLGRLGSSREIWSICGVPYLDEPEFESGQIVLDKERCWRALSLCMWYNEHSDFYYRYVHGDKETFHLAFRKVNKTYAMPERGVQLLEGTYCQHDFEGLRLWQHRNGEKWDYTGPNKTIPDFQYEEECRMYLQNLRQKWNGRIDAAHNYEASLKSQNEKTAAQILTATVHEYQRGENPPRLMAFSLDGYIGQGASEEEYYWDLHEDKQGLILEISSMEALTCRMSIDKDGVWRGRDAENAPTSLRVAADTKDSNKNAVMNKTPEADQKDDAAAKFDKLLCQPDEDSNASHGLSLEDFIHKIINQAEPLSQNVGENNLGFGWIYYGIARNLRPDFVVAIGSCQGFAPFCAARALKDNGKGKVIFIDPSYSGEGHPGWSGKGFWSDPVVVENWIREFELNDWITHIKAISEQAFPRVREMIGSGNLNLVIIDGAHTCKDSMRDFELYSSLMKEGFVVLHDSVNTACGVSNTVHALKAKRYPIVTLNRDAGLSLVEIGAIPTLESRWDYLCKPSDRGERILPFALDIIRHGDLVLDIYCGYSPLGFLLKDVKIIGWDPDLTIINRLRRELPQHRWEQIDELTLPFAEFLPEEVHVIMGLGLSRGRAAWDLQCALDNTRYLLGRYYPRACLFETALDYCNADILDDLEGAVRKLGYTVRMEEISTNMESYYRRKLLIAEH